MYTALKAAALSIAVAAITTPHANAAAMHAHGVLLGELPARTNLTLYIRLQGPHDGELDNLAQAMMTPGSTAYGRYLTPEQFGRYFGAPPATYAAALTTLRSRGFTIDWLGANRTDIVVHAPVSIVSAFFRTPIDVRYEGGRSFFINRYEPQAPSGLPIDTVSGLDDSVQLHPMMVRNPNAIIGHQFSWAPADVAAAYDLNPLYAKGLDGSGVTIANATCGAASASDLLLFQKQFKLPAAQLLTTPVGGNTTPACGYYSNIESSIDVDAATLVARNATFHQVVAHGPANHDFDLAYGYIVNNLGSTVHVVTTSWGLCEHTMAKSPSLKIDEKLMAQAAMEGQRWFSASGDFGTDDCAVRGYTKISVDFPGSSPYVMSVGGTTIKGKKVSGNIVAWVSETVWQQSNSNGASGGGKSMLYSKPQYQVALTPKDGARDVPDVALFADGVNDGLWFANMGHMDPTGNGTSEAAPMWAGLLAIVEQRHKNRVITDPHVRLYQLAGTKAYHSLFHDITVGNNGVTDNYGTFPGYTAGPGFDLCTGLGTFIGAALVNAY